MSGEDRAPALSDEPGLTSMKEHRIAIGPALTAELHLHARSRGLVMLLDGSAGARELGRHRFVSGLLQRRQFATLMLEPDQPPSPVAESAEVDTVHRLSHGLLQAMRWTQEQPRMKTLPLGIFGSGPGAAAAMVCAAEQSLHMAAVVAAAPPLDLVAAEWSRVQVPVLFIVGRLDDELLTIARRAYLELGTQHKRLEVIPRATRLFEEAGAMERVAMLAADWFEHFLVPQPAA